MRYIYIFLANLKNAVRSKRYVFAAYENKLVYQLVKELHLLHFFEDIYRPGDKIYYPFYYNKHRKAIRLVNKPNNIIHKFKKVLYKLPFHIPKNKRTSGDLSFIGKPFINLTTIREVEILSKPSRKHYVSFRDLKKLNHISKLYILSTPLGIITSNLALKFKSGGLLLAVIHLP